MLSYPGFSAVLPRLVENVSPNTVGLLNKVRDFIEVSGEEYTETVLSTNLYEDDVSPWDDWDAPYVLVDNGDGFDVSRTYSYDDTAYWAESWSGKPDGERVDDSYKQVPQNEAAQQQLDAYHLSRDSHRCLDNDNL